MSISATSSEPRRRLRRSLTLALGLLLAAAGGARGQSQMSQQEALQLAFPGATVERRTAFLGDAELAAVRRLAGKGVEVRGGVVTYYVASRNGQPLGTAYFDAHRVRTLPEVLMLVVDPQGSIERIEVVRFAEPPQYRAPAGWLRQFHGKRLSESLSLRRGVVGITGATLTSDATTDAARRVLALHQVIRATPASAAR